MLYILIGCGLGTKIAGDFFTTPYDVTFMVGPSERPLITFLSHIEIRNQFRHRGFGIQRISLLSAFGRADLECLYFGRGRQSHSAIGGHYYRTLERQRRSRSLSPFEWISTFRLRLVLFVKRQTDLQLRLRPDHSGYSAYESQNLRSRWGNFIDFMT